MLTVGVVGFVLALPVVAQTNKPSTKKSPPRSAKAAPKKKLLAETTGDGSFIANGWFRKFLYETIAFQKRGSNVVGYAYGYDKHYCFRGTAEGNIINVNDAIAWDNEYANGRQTGRRIFRPVTDDEKPDVREFRMTDVLESFPRYYIGPYKQDDVPEQEATMKQCVDYFNQPRLESPPCGDEALRGTDKNAGTGPKYQSSSTVCTITEDTQYVALIETAGGACSVENVFDVLIQTPSAIAPTIHDEQPVENCGVLDLMGNNRIKIEIDEENHRILNYTMPGHQFFPGRVIRQIVEENGEVKVVTTGTGKLAWWKKAENQIEAVPIWATVDQRLKVMFARAHKPDDDQ